MESKLDKLYEVIKENMLNLGVEESEVDLFMRSNKFTISFGETEVWENRNSNPKLVKKEATTISYERK